MAIWSRKNILFCAAHVSYPRRVKGWRFSIRAPAAYFLHAFVSLLCSGMGGLKVGGFYPTPPLPQHLCFSTKFAIPKNRIMRKKENA
jgi:hypothetical protein